jgi:hypothetical protein
VEVLIKESGKFVQKKATLIKVPLHLTVPPILHIKLKVGNELFLLLKTCVQNELPKFNEVLKKWNLNVDRKEEGIIYSTFNGNDVKRFCSAINDFALVTQDTDYQNVIQATRDFDLWANLVSQTTKIIPENVLQNICCKNEHASDKKCCQTAVMCSNFEKIPSFCSSLLIHVTLMHVGPFLWKHQKLGCIAEEGIEAVHSRLANEMSRHKVPLQQKLLRGVKWLAIDVLLSDGGEIE